MKLLVDARVDGHTLRRGGSEIIDEEPMIGASSGIIARLCKV